MEHTKFTIYEYVLCLDVDSKLLTFLCAQYQLNLAIIAQYYTLKQICIPLPYAFCKSNVKSKFHFIIYRYAEMYGGM